MKLRYTLQAASDLEAIADYLNHHSPQGAASVGGALRRALANIEAFPRLGRRQSVQGVRKIATRRFPYLIYYSLDLLEDEIVILTIRHAATNRPLSEL